mmetsp:Transcript_38327/g.119122  ORF Transcript_38327/g.119122 Transcript_38327/m.119122 type:complete len:219 (-) Transcript_38327:343-999(-)
MRAPEVQHGLTHRVDEEHEAHNQHAHHGDAGKLHLRALGVEVGEDVGVHAPAKGDVAGDGHHGVGAEHQEVCQQGHKPLPLGRRVTERGHDAEEVHLRHEREEDRAHAPQRRRGQAEELQARLLLVPERLRAEGARHDERADVAQRAEAEGRQRRRAGDGPRQRERCREEADAGLHECRWYPSQADGRSCGKRSVRAEVHKDHKRAEAVEENDDAHHP